MISNTQRTAEGGRCSRLAAATVGASCVFINRIVGLRLRRAYVFGPFLAAMLALQTIALAARVVSVRSDLVGRRATAVRAFNVRASHFALLSQSASAIRLGKVA